MNKDLTLNTFMFILYSELSQQYSAIHIVLIFTGKEIVSQKDKFGSSQNFFLFMMSLVSQIFMTSLNHKTFLRGFLNCNSQNFSQHLNTNNLATI